VLLGEKGGLAGRQGKKMGGGEGGHDGRGGFVGRVEGGGAKIVVAPRNRRLGGAMSVRGG